MGSIIITTHYNSNITHNIMANVITEKSIHNFKPYIELLNNNDIDPYADSQFKVIQNLTSKKKGRFFELLVEDYARKQGWKINKPDNTDHDTKINGKKVEIKGSFRWVEKGKLTHYRWQQIRPDDDYELMIFVAVNPTKLGLFCASKQEVTDYVTIQDEHGNYPHNQHGGMKVNSGTFHIDGLPSQFSFMRDLKEHL